MAKNSKDQYIKLINGNYWARVTYLDQFGKKHEFKRRAQNKTHAKQLAQQLLAELEIYGANSALNAQMNFLELANYYEEKYLVEPIYVDDRKVAGLRGAYAYKLLLKVLKEYFGSKKIRSITHGDIEAYRMKRLSTPITYKDPEKPGKQRALATVNRELALLRRMLNIAHREGWILRTPFLTGDKLISIADEKKRERILTKEEEKLLLENCVDLRSHLKPIIILALDTGMRAGEIFSLCWKDINFESNLITIQALNTKTLQSRQIAMTARLQIILGELFLTAKSLENLVFGIKSVNHSFATLRKLCNLPDVRFHDLRHTAATRMIQQGVPLQEVGRVLGHTQANTTYRYINLNIETARRAAAALDSFHEMKEKMKEEKQEASDRDEYIS